LKEDAQPFIPIKYYEEPINSTTYNEENEGALSDSKSIFSNPLINHSSQNSEDEDTMSKFSARQIFF
jgi:hypothetical protein